MYRDICFACLFLFSIFWSTVGFGQEYWMLLDSSASLSAHQARLRNESSLGYAQVLLFMDKSSRIGVMDFAENIKILSPTRDINKIKSFINTLGHAGNLTDIEAALEYFKKHPTAKNCNLYLFTDGQPDIAPSRCSSCLPTPEDIQSINRIKDSLVPYLAKKGAMKINAVGLGEHVDMKLLQAIAYPTGGGVKRITSIDQLLPALTQLWQVFESRSPNLNQIGNQVKVDGQVTSNLGFIGPLDMRVRGPVARDQGRRRSINLPGVSKRITLIDKPSTGKYVYSTNEPDKVKVLSNIDIDIVAVAPSGRKYVYQYEVLPFEIALKAKDRNQKILEKLSQNLIQVNVNILGDCKDSLDLQYDHKQKRIYWYKNKWWADCNLGGQLAQVRYIYYIKDNADINTKYDLYQGISSKLVPVNYDLKIKQKTPSHLANFKRSPNTFWVSEKICPKLLFPLPDGLVATLSTNYYLEGKPLPNQGEYLLKQADLGQKNLYAKVKCRNNKSSEIDFKFKKEIQIASSPFQIKAGQMGSYILGLPAWFKIPFAKIQGMPKERIELPFVCKVNRDRLSLVGYLQAPKLKPDQNSFQLSLAKNQKEFQLYFTPQGQISPGDYKLNVSLDSQKYLNSPNEYMFNLTVVSPWPYLISILVFFIGIIYGLILILYYLKRPVYCLLKSNLPGLDPNCFFPLRFFPPGRREVVKDRYGKKICTLKLSCFSNKFIVQSHQAQPGIYNIQGVEIKGRNISIPKTGYFSFNIVYNQPININLNIQRRM